MTPTQGQDATSTLAAVAGDMQRMYALHQQPAGRVVDLALSLLEHCGWETWPADGGTRQAIAFEKWRGSRDRLAAYRDPHVAVAFPIFVQALAISQCFPSIRIGLTRSALICMHGFFAQARATFRATVEECLYAFMLMKDPEHARLYLAEHDRLWKESGSLRRQWSDAIAKQGSQAPGVPAFGHVLVGIYQKHIHGGSHGGFFQVAHRSRGTIQTFVDAKSPHLGAYSVAFAGAVLRLVDGLTAYHPQVNQGFWRTGLADFERHQQPILATLLASQTATSAPPFVGERDARTSTPDDQ